jgi:drug/metabolite transporter (DMT)-like permease
MAQNTVQLIQRAVLDDQFTLATVAVGDLHAGAQAIGEIVLQGAYQGLLVSLAALLLMARTVQTLGATTTAVFMAGVPPLSGLLSIPVLGEVPGPLEWAGMALTAVGIALASGAIGGAMGWTFGPVLRRISNR